MPHFVSVIATVLNEAQAVDTLMSSLMAQTRLPDEIVIIDGGSNDGTLELLKKWQGSSPVPLRIQKAPGCNIAQGRNAAINLAQGDIIAVTDAGVRLPTDWLATLLAPLDSSEPPDVISGFFAADPHSLFERVLGAISLPRLAEVNPAHFAPSSRSVAFTRQAWLEVGGYPEWLDYCEDLVFDFALQDVGLRFAFAPDALVWFRPRPNLGSFYRQYYRYGRGDGKADLYIFRHLMRYTTYLALGASILLSILIHPLFLLVTAAALAAVLQRSLRRLYLELSEMPMFDKVRSLLWLPVIVITGDVAKMLGYPMGVMWRLKHAPKEHWARRRI
ncbi:MAG: glycosyltransferase [Chloroflexi bacterium]|nr:glycosyltransferase [Chloroflexota bacterium]